MSNIVIDLLNKRIASRAISTEPLSNDTISELIEAARLTPSCFNKQPWRFLFLVSEEALEKGRKALTGGNVVWATRAPLLIVGYSRYKDDCVLADGRYYNQFDLGMSVMNIMLAATDKGLIARPMAGFNPALISELFALTSSEEPMIMIAVGKQSDDESHLSEKLRQIDTEPRSRLSAADIAKVI